jgi:hypothetical protein
MPAGFYWDGILFIVLGTIGLMSSLFLQLSMVPGWRARARAMKENSTDRSEVKTAIADENEPEIDETEDSTDVEATDSVEETETLDDEKPEEPEELEEEEEDGIDIGSYIGLVLEDEEVFGTIIEFDDEEGLVTLEEDGSGDLVTGYQDDMFLDD